MKIYVDKMPKATGQGVENQEELEIRMIFDGNKTADIELIHEHDKELVEKVLEEVSKELENETETYCEIRHYQGDYLWFNYVKFRKFAEKLQKEYKK